jgi:drug/metabolite transporter (DMT)-like permease
VIVALVVVSAFLHALWNALLRLEKEKDRSLVTAIGVATVVAAIVAAVRWGLGEVLFASWRGVGFTVLAGVMEAVYFTTLAKAMELGRLGMVYTISRGGAVLAVWPLSMALFGEVAKVSSLVGSVVVIGGLAMSGLGSAARTSGHRAGASAHQRDGHREAGGDEADVGQRERERRAVGWAVACALAIAGYHLAYSAALSEAVNPSACFALSLGVSVAINATRLRRAGRGGFVGLLRQRWRRLVVMGVVSSGSFLLLMEALARSEAGYVLTLRNTSVLFAVVMSWRIGERPARAEILGAALVALGAALLTL